MPRTGRMQNECDICVRDVVYIMFRRTFRLTSILLGRDHGMEMEDLPSLLEKSLRLACQCLHSSVATDQDMARACRFNKMGADGGSVTRRERESDVPQAHDGYKVVDVADCVCRAILKISQSNPIYDNRSVDVPTSARTHTTGRDCSPASSSILVEDTCSEMT